MRKNARSIVNSGGIDLTGKVDPSVVSSFDEILSSKIAKIARGARAYRKRERSLPRNFRIQEEE